MDQGVTVNSLSQYNCTPIHLALFRANAQCGCEASIRVFIQENCDLTIEENWSNEIGPIRSWPNSTLHIDRSKLTAADYVMFISHVSALAMFLYAGSPANGANLEITMSHLDILEQPTGEPIIPKTEKDKLPP